MVYFERAVILWYHNRINLIFGAIILGLILLVFIIAISAFVIFQNAKEAESNSGDPKEKYKLSKRFMITVFGSFVFLLIVFVVAFIYF